VIFDTAASMSVFKNPNPLTNVASSGFPTMIGVVQQGPLRVRIDDVRNFRDFGEVGIGKVDACTILYAYQMLDTNGTFKYDNKKESSSSPA
jgi:hypothetical protein